MRSSHLIFMTLTVALISLTGPRAQATAIPDPVAQFASRHGVRVKQVTRKVGNRQIHRIFVPLVRGETAMSKDFIQTFLTQDRMLLFGRPYMSQTYPYNYYVRAAFSPETNRTNAEVWASAYDVGPKASIKNTKIALNPVEGSRTVVLNIGQHAVQNAKGFLRRFHKSQSYDRNIRVYKQTMEQEGKRAGDCAADCMWWLTNLNVSDLGVHDTHNLMQLLGTKRTRGPQEMPPLAIHAAKNAMVEVIGVGVNSKEDFNAMRAAQLMGPTPTRGDKASWIRD